MPSSVLLNGALIDSELRGKVIDRNLIGVALDQLLHLGWLETPTDPSRGSSFGRFGPRRDNFEEAPETFSLVRMVQVTSHYLHSWSI
jgi:hypothetical protein